MRNKRAELSALFSLLLVCYTIEKITSTLYQKGESTMAEGKGRSSSQGVKLLYIRDYQHKQKNKEHPKNATEMSDYLGTKGIKADRKTICNDMYHAVI